MSPMLQRITAQQDIEAMQREAWAIGSPLDGKEHTPEEYVQAARLYEHAAGKWRAMEGRAHEAEQVERLARLCWAAAGDW